MDKDNLMGIVNVPDKDHRKFGSLKVAEALVEGLDVKEINYLGFGSYSKTVVADISFDMLIGEVPVKSTKGFYEIKLPDSVDRNRPDENLVNSAVESFSEKLLEDKVRLVRWYSHGVSTLPKKFRGKIYVTDLNRNRNLGQEIPDDYIRAYQKIFNEVREDFKSEKLVRSPRPINPNGDYDVSSLEELCRVIFGEDVSRIRNYNLAEYPNFLRTVLSFNDLFEFESRAKITGYLRDNWYFKFARESFSKTFFRVLDEIGSIRQKSSYDNADIIYAVQEANSAAAECFHQDISVSPSYHGYGTGKRNR